MTKPTASITITLADEEARKTFETSLIEVDLAIHDAAAVFAMLRDIVSQSATVPDGVPALLNICARAYATMAGRESEDLERLYSLFQTARFQVTTAQTKGPT
jgi:hypothetical protein